MIIRNPYKNEIPTLNDIWVKVFGNEGVGAFFDTLYCAEHTIVAELSGELAAMGYIVPCGELHFGASQQRYKCVMLYSIATLPGHRGKGLGASVTNALIENAYRLGYQACVLCPSQDSLFNFYTDNTAMQEWFYADIVTITADQIVSSCLNSADTSSLEELAPKDYGKLRETILKDAIHIIYNTHILDYQKRLCEEAGGGLFRVNNSCAAIEVLADGSVGIKELLLAQCDDAIDVIGVISGKFAAKGYTYRAPAKSGQGTGFGMITFKDSAPPPVKTKNAKYSPWYGLAFD